MKGIPDTKQPHDFDYFFLRIVCKYLDFLLKFNSVPLATNDHFIANFLVANVAYEFTTDLSLMYVLYQIIGALFQGVISDYV